jgi:hypothetical protein
MKKHTTGEMSLTEARRRSGAIIRIDRTGASYSNARQIPYAETYRLSTALQETPLERLQRAAEDEAGRDSY